MKVFVFNIAKLFRASVFAVVLFSAAIPAFGYNHVHSSLHFNYDKRDKSDEEAEKNITNVKVIYNPVSEQINVNFKVGKQNTVVIKLMDALGNEVLSLSNGTLEAGAQSLSFDTDGKIAAGFYFVRLTSGTETVIKRLSIR